jgi:hypothetical protein
MIYASTRIKRSAAAAFEAETVETEDFIIEKSEGFLNVIGGDPKLAFEAYSKDFGSDGADKFRLATANVVVASDTTLKAAADDILNAKVEVVDDRTETRNGNSYRVIEHLVNEEDVEFRVYSKMAERDNKVFVFTIKSIAETTSEFASDIEAMLDSFELK